MSEEGLVNLIDGVLRKDDKNNDRCKHNTECAKSLQQTLLDHLLVVMQT